MTYLVDSHCHLASLSLEGKGATSIKEALIRARHCGVTHFLCVACTPYEHEMMLEKIKDFKGIFTACGVHPVNLEEAGDWKEEDLIACLKAPSTVALGETGLDYHYAKETAKAQLDSFARQIDVAVELKLPLIIHAREAHLDTVSLMKSHEAREAGGVMHCFCDGIEMARKCLDLGFYISFSGIATFKAAENVREVARFVPIDRMLVETDCPYLAPVPVRGVENEPAYVRYTLEFLASLKGVSPKTLAEVTSHNFEDLFKVKLEDVPPLEGEVSTYKLEKIFDKPLI